MEIAISKIVVGKRHRRDLGDISSLADSLDELGVMMHPVVVTEDYRLIAGERRIAAARKLGWKDVPVHIVSELKETMDLLKAERDENTCRKDLSPLEGVALGKKIEEMVRPKMKERQATSTGGKNPKSKPASPNLGEAGNGNLSTTERAAAAAAGMSHGSYAEAKAVADAAERDPEKYQAIAEEMDRTGKVHTAYRKFREREAIGSIDPEKLKIKRDAYNEWADIFRVVNERMSALTARLGSDRAKAARKIAEPTRHLILSSLTPLVHNLTEWKKELEHANKDRN